MHVRVILAWTNDSSEKITLDLCCDQSGNASSRWVISGWMGRLNQPDELYPFLLYPKTGEMDFGAFATQAERFASLNLMKKPIAVGEYVTYCEDNEESTYRIERVEPVEY